MICDECKKKMYAQALSSTHCQVCGNQFMSPHIPEYKVCTACSEKKHLCQQCGKEIPVK